MFVYCILPEGNLKCNFIKIGYCVNYENLKKRYSTYYGSDLKFHYVKVNNKNTEKHIHEELKKRGLHLKNELFIYNDKFDFDFYIKVLDEFDCDYDLQKSKKDHFFTFFIYISIKNINKKVYNIKKEYNEYKYLEEIESTIDNYNNEMIWSYYLLFCKTQFKQYYKNEEQIKDYINLLLLNKKSIKYKNFTLEIKDNIIKNTITNEIEFKEFIFNKYNLIVNTNKKIYFEKYLDVNTYIQKDELLRLINNNRYYYTYINIYKIIINDNGNKKLNIVKYFDFSIYIKEYIKNKKIINFLSEESKYKKDIPQPIFVKEIKWRNPKWKTIDILWNSGF